MTTGGAELTAQAGRNLPRVNVMESRNVGPLALVQHAKVVVTEGALRELEERLS